MALQLYYHPFSSYSQKALVALHEHGLDFEPRVLEGPDSPAMQELAAMWPIRRFPVLVDTTRGRTILEATCVVEYLDRFVDDPARRLLPQDPDAALDVRMWDRVFDQYVSTPQQRVVYDALRPEASRDPYGVEEAKRQLETIYQVLDQRMAGREWVAADRFTLADCGAAPFLFYAHWTHPIDGRFARLHAYRQRLMARPSFARCIEDARPFRSYFPLGVPEVD